MEMMDRNELVEKAARAIAGRNRYEDQSRNYILQARRAIDAILPDVIEHVLEEATEAMWRVEIEDRPGDYHKPDLIWVTDANWHLDAVMIYDLTYPPEQIMMTDEDAGAADRIAAAIRAAEGSDE